MITRYTELKHVNQVVSIVLGRYASKATKYISPTRVVKATRRFGKQKRARTMEIIVTMGAPNYAERKFIKLFEKANCKFPIRKVQMRG